MTCHKIALVTHYRKSRPMNVGIPFNRLNVFSLGFAGVVSLDFWFVGACGREIVE